VTTLRDPTAPGARRAPLGPTFVRLRRGVVVSLRSRLGGLFKSQSELELTDGSIPKSLFFLSLPIAYVAWQGIVPVDLLVFGSWTPVDIWFAFAVSGITAALVAASWFELGKWRGMDLSGQPDDGASAPADGAAASGDAAGDAEPRSDARAATTVVSVRCIVSRSAYCSITERSPAPGDVPRGDSTRGPPFSQRSRKDTKRPQRGGWPRAVASVGTFVHSTETTSTSNSRVLPASFGLKSTRTSSSSTWTISPCWPFWASRYAPSSGV